MFLGSVKHGASAAAGPGPRSSALRSSGNDLVCGARNTSSASATPDTDWLASSWSRRFEPLPGGGAALSFVSEGRGSIRPVDMSDVLLISGLPGAGKTQYTDWLSGQGWGYLRSDESADHPALLAAIFNDDDGPLRAAADGYPTGFVVEWGLPVGCLPQLKAMLRRADYDAWYFNGNPDAAFAAWQQRKDRTPDDESNCHRQFADLEASFETRRPSAPADRCRPGVVRRRRNSTQDSVRSRIASGLTFPKSRASVPALRPRRTRRDGVLTH